MQNIQICGIIIKILTLKYLPLEKYAMKLPKIKQNSNFPLIHLRPMLFAALGFVLGIICLFQYVIYRKTYVFFIFCVFLFILLGFAIYQTIRKSEKILLFCTVIASIFAICGGFSAYAQISAYEHKEINPGYYTVYGTVSDISELEDGHSLLLTDLVFKTENTTITSDHKMNLIVFNKGSDVYPGKRIRTYVLVNLQEKGEYYTYQMANGIKFVAFTGGSSVVSVGNTKNFFEKVRLKGESILSKYLTGDALYVATGMLFGNTEGMQENTLTQFRELGIAHIFAVSGLHIGFLCVIITKLLRRTEARNPLRFLLPSIAVFFYAGVCGFTPSALRAAIVCATVLFFGFIGAPHDALSGVLFSAIVVLALNPADVTSYGFILSYACVLSIIIISPLFRKHLRFLPNKLGEGLSISLGIQVGVFPVQMALFGYAAPISVLLNLLFIPIITPIYIIVLAILLCAAIIPAFGLLFTIIEKVFVFLLYILDKLPRGITVKNLEVNGGMPIYYLGVLLASYHVNLRKGVKIAASALCFAAFLLTVFL